MCQRPIFHSFFWPTRLGEAHRFQECMPIRFMRLNYSNERYVRETRVFAICVVQFGVGEAFGI
jgi:hypothetical protein